MGVATHAEYCRGHGCFRSRHCGAHRRHLAEVRRHLEGVPIEAYALRHFASGTDYDERWDSPPMVSHLAAHAAPSSPAPRRAFGWRRRLRNGCLVSPLPPQMSEKVLLRLRNFAVAATQQWAVTTLRFFLNFWVASCRMHIGETDPCLYGCRASDHFPHYLQCPFRRSAISSTTGREVGGVSVSHCFGICDGDGAENLEEDSSARRSPIATLRCASVACRRTPTA